MRVVRALQERTGGITEFVPLSFIPFNTMLGARTGSRRSRPTRTSSTRRRSGWRSGRTIPNLQASWVKMGLEAATEALRWGVNDLGGTLMEENISRMAGSQHGVRLEPEQLIEAARAAGRVPAQRTTLYEIVETYERPTAAEASLTRIALGGRLAEEVLVARAAQGRGARPVLGADERARGRGRSPRDAARLVADQVGGGGSLVGDRDLGRLELAPAGVARRASRRAGRCRRSRSRPRPGRGARRGRSCR